jgi:hypothetical protein
MTLIFNIKEKNNQETILKNTKGEKLIISSSCLPNNLKTNDEILVHIEKNNQENKNNLAKKILNTALNPQE